MTTATATNTGTRPIKVGKANTHVIHITGNGRHANCGYNGAGRDLRGVDEIAPNATVSGNLCGRCFKHYPKTGN